MAGVEEPEPRPSNKELLKVVEPPEPGHGLIDAALGEEGRERSPAVPEASVGLLFHQVG